MIENAILYKEIDGFEYWKIREIGFSNKKLALHNKLYANFGMFQTSTYYSIFKHALYSTNETLQFWIMDKNIDKPIGLAVAIRFHQEAEYNIEDKMGLNPGIILGQLHFFLKNEYRGKGLNKILVPIMEEFLLEKSLTSVHSCVVMENRAYSLAKYTNSACILSHSCNKKNMDDDYNLFIRKGIRFKKYQDYFEYAEKYFPKEKIAKKQINMF